MPMSRAKRRASFYVCVIAANQLAEKFLYEILASDASIEVVDLESFSDRHSANPNPAVFLIDNFGLPLPLSEYLRRLRCQYGESKYMVLDHLLNKEQIFRLLWLGIDGFLVYDDVQRALLAAIQSVASGNIWMPREILREFIQRTKETKGGGSNKLEGLTFRETQIMELVRRRLTNKEIAEALRISESTVKFHASNIFSKLQVAGRHAILETRPPSGNGKLIPNPAAANG